MDLLACTLSCPVVARKVSSFDEVSSGLRLKFSGGGDASRFLKLWTNIYLFMQGIL